MIAGWRPYEPMPPDAFRQVKRDRRAVAAKNAECLFRFVCLPWINPFEPALARRPRKIFTRCRRRAVRADCVDRDDALTEQAAFRAVGALDDEGVAFL